MENLGIALVDVIKNEKLQDVAKELTEFSIDSILNDGLLKDFPALSFLTGLYNLKSSIQDKLFLKKVFAFFSNLDSTTVEQRQKMINDIETSDDYNIKVGEKLLFIIDKCDDFQKAEIVGSLFNQFLKNKISYDEFLLCCSIVEKCLMKDLIGFVKSYFSTFNMLNDADLLNWGLLIIENIREDKIVLDISKGGSLLKTNLIPFIDSRIHKLELRSKSVLEIENYFTKIFANFSTTTRWLESIQIISEVTSELCNNYILTDDEFNLVVFRVHQQGFGLKSESTLYINELQMRNDFNKNEFNYRRWEKYEIFYAWNENKLQVKPYQKPANEYNSIL